MKINARIKIVILMKYHLDFLMQKISFLKNHRMNIFKALNYLFSLSWFLFKKRIYRNSVECLIAFWSNLNTVKKIKRIYWVIFKFKYPNFFDIFFNSHINVKKMSYILRENKFILIYLKYRRADIIVRSYMRLYTTSRCNS